MNTDLKMLDLTAKATIPIKMKNTSNNDADGKKDPIVIDGRLSGIVELANIKIAPSVHEISN